MNIGKLRITELMLISLTGVLTVIFQPPIPLLSIPFVFIIGMRSICITLEDSQYNEEGNLQ